MSRAVVWIDGRIRVGSVAALCGLLIMFDGYDMAVYGCVAPALPAEPGWAATPGDVGAIGSLNLVAMLVGAISGGLLADRFGRRRILLVAVAWLSAGMLVCSTAPSVALFGTARGLTGLAMGALFPLVTALLREVAADSSVARHATLLSALSLAGVFAGGVLAGLASVPLVGGNGGWRAMFLFGAAASLLLPILARYLPESRAWLRSAGPADGPGGVRVLLGPGFRRTTTAAWALLFCSLLLNFAMLTWLPTTLGRMGLPPFFAQASMAVLNLSAAAGGLVAGLGGDRYGPKTVVAGMFGLGAAALLGLGTAAPGSGWMLALVAVTGIGTLGTQMLATIFVGSVYPTRLRGAGLGWGLGVGRLGAIAAPVIGGALLESVLPPQTLFLVLAAVAALGLLAVLAAPTGVPTAALTGNDRG